MIDKLKFLIDEYENNPEFKGLFLKIAALPENKQEEALQFIEQLIAMRGL